MNDELLLSRQFSDSLLQLVISSFLVWCHFIDCCHWMINLPELSVQYRQ